MTAADIQKIKEVIDPLFSTDEGITVLLSLIPYIESKLDIQTD